MSHTEPVSAEQAASGKRWLVRLLVAKLVVLAIIAVIVAVVVLRV